MIREQEEKSSNKAAACCSPETEMETQRPNGGELEKETNSRKQSIFSKLFQSRHQTSKQKKRATDKSNSDSTSEFDGDPKFDSSQEKRSFDQDSYELDLNSRLALEKLRASGAASSSSTSSSSTNSSVASSSLRLKAIDLSKFPREKLEWRINEHYAEMQRNSEKNKVETAQKDATSSICKLKPKGTFHNPQRKRNCSNSTELEEFLELSRNFSIHNAVSEQDLRLVEWRKLASKAASQLSDSDVDSDDDLDRNRGQLVGLWGAISCSDDTSCSSVELVWSPGGCHQSELEAVRTVSSNSAPIVHLLEAPEVKPQEAVICKLDNDGNNNGGFLRRLSVFELARPKRSKARERRLNNWVANPLFSSSINVESDEPVARHTLESSTEEADVEASSKRLSWSASSTRRKLLVTMSDTTNKVKENMRSLSERFSDTGKRASLLADSFISSIKETTKDLGGNSSRQRLQDDLEFESTASFASSKPISAVSSSAERSQRARQFSLIYKHQQQANGQPVITSQPKPALGNSISLRPSPWTPSQLSPIRTKTEVIEKIVPVELELEKLNLETVEPVAKESSDDARQTESAGNLSVGRNTSDDATNSGCNSPVKLPPMRKKRRKRRRDIASDRLSSISSDNDIGIGSSKRVRIRPRRRRRDSALSLGPRSVSLQFGSSKFASQLPATKDRWLTQP